jgi:hypothetical protein
VRAAAAAVVLATTALAEAPGPGAGRPHLVASVHLSPLSSFPELLGAQLTVHAIPFVEVQAGLGGFVERFAWWVRGGLRYLFNDWRDEQHRGLTWRLALLAGYRSARDPRVAAAGFSGLAATDFDWFFADHLALSVQLALGGMYDAAGKRVLPELRLGVGASF